MSAISQQTSKLPAATSADTLPLSILTYKLVCLGCIKFALIFKC